MALSPNVVVVAPGDLITADHLNKVRSNLDRIDISASAKVPMAGVTTATPITGNLYIGGDPSVGAGMSLGVSGQIVSSRTGTAPIGSPSLMVARGSSPGAGAPNEPLVGFYRGPTAAAPLATQIGTITISAGANGVVYNTTSDPRIKQRDGDIVDAAERARQLGRAAFRGRMLSADTGGPVGDERDLLSSHDIEDIAGYAVTGERDAVDDDGQPVYQQVSYGDLVPLLFAALADALDRIDALEAAA